MNGFEKQELNDDDFGAQGSIVSAFDAFRTPCLHPASQHTLLLGSAATTFEPSS